MKMIRAAVFRRESFLYFALAAIGGGGGVLGFAPERLWPLAPMSLALLFWICEKVRSPKEAAIAGFFYGAGFFGFGVNWIFVSLHEFGGIPAPFAVFATALFCAILSLYPTLAMFLAKTIFIKEKIPPSPFNSSGGILMRVAHFAVVWTFCEWLRGWLFTGFPWLAHGYAHIAESPLSGFAPLFGIYGVTFFSALGGGCVIAIMLARHRIEKIAAAIIIILISALGGGGDKIEWSEKIKTLSVSLLQGNVPQDIKWEKEAANQALVDYLKMANESRSELIIAPETALPFFLDDLPDEYINALALQGGGVVVGIFTEEEGKFYNAAVAIGEFGRKEYRKSHLVPYGEYLPFESLLAPIVDAFRIPYSNLSSGEGGEGLNLPQVNLGMTICYEDAFGEEVMLHLPRAELLANLTNDAWFNSRMQFQHLQMSQARALEGGRYMVRATNTGATAIINHKGMVESLAPINERIILEGEVLLMRGATPYSRWRNWPIAVFISGWLAAIFIFRMHRRIV